uniref:Polynucleotide kinase 3'-phosphatase n=1 Tax=Steinernema glaseri TaxID=37863 RepID=A0A1I8A4L9_9BILA
MQCKFGSYNCERPCFALNVYFGQLLSNLIHFCCITPSDFQGKRAQKTMSTTGRGTKRGATVSGEKVYPMFNKKKAAQAAPVQGKWDAVGDELLVFSPDDHRASENIAGFDLDYTLIATKSGKTFPVDHNDWKLWHDSVPQKLRKAHEEGFKVVIFTNQKGVQAGKLTTTNLKKKMHSILAKFDIPVQVFASLGPPSFRKPYVGMWTYMEEQYNDGIPVNREESLYVGDAAGRPKTKVVNRDSLKTWQACVAAADGFLENKQSVVIDNTSPDKESR